METYTLLADLDKLHVKTQSARKKKHEKELFDLYDKFATAYLKAPIDERIDMQIAFDGKDQLLVELIHYLQNLAEEASKTAKRSKKSPVNQLLQKGIAVDALIDGRLNKPTLEDAQTLLLETADLTGLDIAACAKKLEITAADYVRRAYHLNQSHDRAQAARTLGHALQINPAFANNQKVAWLAASITGQPSEQALETLSSSFFRQQYCHQLETNIKPAFSRSAEPHSPTNKPAVEEKTLSKAEVRTRKAVLTLAGLLLVFGITIGIYFLINHFFPHEPDKYSRRFNINMMYMVGIGGAFMIITGVATFFRGEVDMSHFINSDNGKRQLMDYSGPSARIVGFYWAATGYVFLGSGLLHFDMTDSFGILTELVSEPLKASAVAGGMLITAFAIADLAKILTTRIDKQA